MHRIATLARAALGVAPREHVLVSLACAALVAAGVALIGAAIFNALAATLGAQAARLALAGAAFALAAAIWAVGALRARRRERIAALARAQIAEDLSRASLGRAGLAAPAAAFVFAFLMGRKG